MAKKKAVSKKKKCPYHPGLKPYTTVVPSKLKHKGRIRAPADKITTPLDNIKTLI